MQSILIVDDDEDINGILFDALTKAGYRALRAYSGTEALLCVANGKPDLVLLDLTLPGLCGEELLPKLKGIPVIIVSAKPDVDNKVNLLLGGAADYITKPFNLKELLARIVVCLRSAPLGESGIICAQELKINTSSREAFVNETPVKLTRTEFAILKLLMQNSTQVITKSTILSHICDDTPDCTESSLKIHVSNLRRKLREATGRDYIEAVWGIGFKLCLEP